MRAQTKAYKPGVGIQIYSVNKMQTSETNVMHKAMKMRCHCPMEAPKRHRSAVVTLFAAPFVQPPQMGTHEYVYDF